MIHNYLSKQKKKVKFIKGEVQNNKITNFSDIKNKYLVNYGIGFDVHRLVPKRKLYLGGIKLNLNLVH